MSVIKKSEKQIGLQFVVILNNYKNDLDDEDSFFGSNLSRIQARMGKVDYQMRDKNSVGDLIVYLSINKEISPADIVYVDVNVERIEEANRMGAKGVLIGRNKKDVIVKIFSALFGSEFQRESSNSNDFPAQPQESRQQRSVKKIQLLNQPRLLS
jgi:hypothetical protein